MTIGTYAELQSAVVDWAYRTDITARVPDFIQLAESDMQVRCKLLDFEASATVTMTAGVGTLPTGFNGMRAAYWDGDTKVPLRYVTPDRYDALSNSTGVGVWYTITGTQIKTAPQTDGNVVMTYKARFTPLSASSTTNVILTNYPDAYLHGALLQFAMWAKDKGRAADEAALFEASIERIKTDNNQRKYAGASLQVQAR